MRLRTENLHRRAETSGVVHALLQGRASCQDYTRLLRNLLPVYHELESALERHRDHRVVRWIVTPELYRAPSIVADLENLHGPGWVREVTLTPAASRYAARIARLADVSPPTLIAHAYTRFLGDLNGGRIVRRLLIRSLKIEPESLSFFDYPGLDVSEYGKRYRTMIDGAGRQLPDARPVTEEAAVAFQLNIALSEAVYWTVPGA